MTDPLVSVDCPVSTLQPGQSTTCTATYTITQADVDAGSVDNTATATGANPSGGDVSSPPDSTSTPTDQVATLELREDRRPAGRRQRQRPGRRGRHDHVLVPGDEHRNCHDLQRRGRRPARGRSDLPEDDVLQPGGSTTCTADGPYVITQADVDAGSVANTAHATGSAPNDPTVRSNDDSTSTPTDQVGDPCAPEARGCARRCQRRRARRRG